MYEILSIGTQFFLYQKLKKANVNKTMRYIFIFWGLLWLLIGIISSYDYEHAEVDIFPLHVTEILRSCSLTWIIITILGFFSFIVIKNILAAAVLTALLTIYCMAEAYFVTPRYVTITSNKIENNVRIAFITDAHIGGLYTYKHFERVMKIVNDSKADLLLLGGDIIDGDMNYRKRELKLLSEAAKNSRYGAFAVNGNHEYYFMLDEDVEGIIRDCGFNLLVFERAEAAGITIIGLDDALNGCLKPFIKPEDKDKFVLVLKHRPGLPFDCENKFDLQLSGHTHGGQFWPLGYFKSMAQDSTQGLTQKSGGYVYVSNGAGFNGAMMRLFTPPEVTIIDIVKEIPLSVPDISPLKGATE